MADSTAQPSLASAPPDADFCAQTQQVLEHLYDFPFLQHNPLARWWESAALASGETAGQRLRREVMTAIESLSPDPGASFRATSARIYNVLQLRYVEGHTVLEVAHKLSISPRQAHRDLRQAEQSVAEVLWANAAAAAGRSAIDFSTVQSDIDHVGSNVRAADVRALLDRARQAVGRLAQSKSVVLHIKADSQTCVVATDVPAAQQLLVSILSHAVKHSQPGVVEAALAAAGDAVQLDVLYQPLPLAGESDGLPLDPVVQQLLERLEWELAQQPAGIGLSPEAAFPARAIRLRIPARRRTVLVIDDNEGLVALLERFLLAHAFSVVKASTGSDGLRIAQEIRPDAIVLDVLLPAMDGWEVLQTLRNDPRTAPAPVIICSVFNEPELAYSLGAAGLLRKPVRREDLLQTLLSLGLV